MNRTTVTLDARINDTDRRMIETAAGSHAFERLAAGQGPAPLAYGARKARLAYTNGLRNLERRLRVAATSVGRWRVGLDATLQSTPVMPLYQKAGIVPPTGIRNLTMRSQFYLVKVTGRLAVARGMDATALRHVIRFSKVGPAGVGQPVVHDFFPRVGARRYRGADVLLGLRSTLLFWVAVTPGGVLVKKPDRIAEKVRGDLIYGPVKYRFEKTHAIGAGDQSKLEWYYPRQAIVNRATFESLLVLRVPWGTRALRLDSAIEASAETPASLRALLGKHRLLRDARHIKFRAA